MLVKSSLLARRLLVGLNVRGLSSSSSGNNKDEYQPVPHYKQMSSLYIKPPSDSATTTVGTFAKLISPELDLAEMFKSTDMDKSLLCLNLSSRHIHLNLNRLRADYLQMRALEGQVADLNRQKDQVSARINELVKSAGRERKKLVMESDAVKSLIKAGNDIKLKINQINEELQPLAEIVNIACIRLPNSLHASALFLDSIESSESKHDRFRHVMFHLNGQYGELMKNKAKLFNHGQADWKQLLDDSIIIDSKVVKAHYAVANPRLSERWSFVRESSIESILNNRYLVGTYAKLEHAIGDFVHDRLGRFDFEHVKGVSMFKSAVVEGCGENFTDTRRIFNIVRFGHPDTVELLHLTGSSSLNALVLNFVRSSVSRADLPWTLYTNGRSYSPNNGQVNCFDLLTLCSDGSRHVPDDDRVEIDLLLNDGRLYLNKVKSQLETFANGKFDRLEDIRHQLTHDNKSLDEVFIAYLKLFVYVYRDFNLPIRFVCLHANQLKSCESFAVQVQAYSPSEQHYQTIGEVSLLNDYVSSRLQIRCEDKEANQQPKHAHMIYCRLMDINAFTQILIESNVIKKLENSIVVSDNDEETSTDSHGQVSFVLPNVLKEFYLV